MNILERALVYLSGRKQSYQVLRSPAAKSALADLAQFCRANETTYHPDPRTHALIEGRREVWLRIQQHLNLSPNELFELYAQAKLEKSK